MTGQRVGGTLVLVRHGQSTANQAGTFTGVLDVPLTPTGEDESRRAGQLIEETGARVEAVFTSSLARSLDSARLICSVLGVDVPPTEDWRLNERNYGSLTGRSKADVLDEYGQDQFIAWRRSVDGTPPPLGDELFDRIAGTPPFSFLPVAALTRTENLRDVIRRVRSFSIDALFPRLQEGETVLVVAHGNSLRAVCAILDDLTDHEVQALNIATGQPLVYQLVPGHGLSPRGGRYLDPVAATAAADALALQGGT